MKFSLSGYYLPTPPAVRKVADSVLAMCTFVGSSTILMGHETIALIFMLCGAVAKFASNLVSEIKDELSNDSKST